MQGTVSHITRIEDGEKFLDTPLFAHEPKHYVLLCGFAYFQSILWKVVTKALANCERWESFPALEHALRLRARAGPPRPSTMAPSPTSAIRGESLTQLLLLVTSPRMHVVCAARSPISARQFLVDAAGEGYGGHQRQSLVGSTRLGSLQRTGCCSRSAASGSAWIQSTLAGASESSDLS